MLLIWNYQTWLSQETVTRYFGTPNGFGCLILRIKVCNHLPYLGLGCIYLREWYRDSLLLHVTKLSKFIFLLKQTISARSTVSHSRLPMIKKSCKMASLACLSRIRERAAELSWETVVFEVKVKNKKQKQINFWHQKWLCKLELCNSQPSPLSFNSMEV